MNNDKNFAISVIINKITKLLEEERYANLEDFISKNPTFSSFILNNKLDTVLNHSKSKIENDDYINILKDFRKKYNLQITETMDKVSSNGNIKNTVNDAVLLTDINYSELDENQKLIYGAAYSFYEEIKIPIKLDINSNLIYDENKNVYTITRNNEGIIINSKKTNTKENEKQKVFFKKYTKEQLKNGFIDAAILAFVTGSFFGALFINLYIKMMHAMN